MHAPFNRIHRDGIVRRIRGEYRHRVAWTQGVNSSLVRIRICRVVGWVGSERDVQVVVGAGDVGFEVLADCWELFAGDPDHAEIAYFASGGMEIVP